MFVIVHTNLSRHFQTGNENGHAVLSAASVALFSHDGPPPHRPNF